MHNEDNVIFDKKLPYEYNICLYFLEELIKEAGPEHKLKVCAYVRVSTIIGECLSTPATNHKRPL